MRIADAAAREAGGEDHGIVIRWKQQSYQEPLLPPPPTSALVLEWNMEPSSIKSNWFDIHLSCQSRDTSMEWTVQRTDEELLKLLPLHPSLSPAFSSSLQSQMEQLILVASNKAECLPDLLQCFEISKWTFNQPRLKEGALEKATGGYESYNRSRWKVLLAQFTCILVSLLVWVLTSQEFVLYLCFAIISLLSLAHWTYYRLNAIDATCVIPCLFFPPVGPVIVIFWAVVMCLFEQRGKRTRWFILRAAHLEFYSEWAMVDETNTNAVLTDVLLLDASTRVQASRIFPTQFICSTPFRNLRLWASTKRERDDWVAKLNQCLETRNMAGVPSSLTPMRDDVPVKHLVDGKDTFASMKEAMLGAKREIFIAGWMLSPEMYLDHGDAMASEFTPLPEQVEENGDGLFQTKQSTLIVKDRERFVYSIAGGVLACYELIVSKRDCSASWVLEGWTNELGNARWLVLDEQRDFDFGRRDVGEPVRFFIQHRARCSKFAFRFTFANEEEEQEDDLEANAAWIRVERFECGGIRLFAHKDVQEKQHDDQGWLQRVWKWVSAPLSILRPSPPLPPPSRFRNSNSTESRLDRIIAQKVAEGVKCYIIMYRDLDLFLSNASFHAKRKLLLNASSLQQRNGDDAGGDLQILRHAPPSRAYGSVQHLFSCSLSKGNTWWSHHEKLVCVDQSIAFVGGLDLAYGRFDDHTHALWDESSSIWRGKDYYNAREKDFENLGLDPYSDSVDRSQVPRMPWHDVHCMVGGAAAMDVARHFIGRWNVERRESVKPEIRRRRAVLVPRYVTMAASAVIPEESSNSMCQVQVLRSVGLWSSPSKVECSILDGYVQLISTAERFIYIEQQFFSSSLAGKPVKNEIARAIADRIVRAIRNREQFRVIILLPVLPAFEGELRSNSSSRSVLHWTLKTIRALRERVERLSGQAAPKDMLGFYSLRKAERNRGKWRSEQIYVHSKLLVVDDARAIIGSANLNDRSMLGTRDSELAVLVQSKEFVSKLRMALFTEHCGGRLLEDVFDAEWDEIATANTLLLERAFCEMPRNAYPTFSAMMAAHHPTATEQQDLLGALRGHLVHFPCEFLSQERQLLPQITRGEREGAIPFENFT